MPSHSGVRLVRESLLAPTLAGIPSRVQGRMGILRWEVRDGNLAPAVKPRAGGFSEADGVARPSGMREGVVYAETLRAIERGIYDHLPGDGREQVVAAPGTVKVRAEDGRHVNNALGFPGIFRGTLDARARDINEEMKIAASTALAELAPEGELVPDFMDRKVHRAVADAVAEAARETGVARK